MDNNDVLIKILERLSVIETQLKDILNVKDDVKEHEKDINDLQNKTDNLKNEIDEIKDTNKWLSRAVLGAIITAVVGVIFCFVKIGLGI